MSSPVFTHRTILPFALTAAFLLALQAIPTLHAATYYWDTNNSTAGFGTAGGTWAAPTTNNSTQGWSSSSAGTDTLSGTTNTTTSDALNFGTASAGLAAGTITISGNVSANSLTFASASGNITLSGGTLSLGGTTPTITTNNTADTIASVLAGSAGMTKNGSATLILTANNTYTGGTTVNAGTLQIGAGTNTTAAVAGITTLSGGNLTYHYNNSSNVNGNITLTAESTITRSNTHQLTFNSGTLNGGGQTLNISAEGTGLMYFNQTAGTSLGQVNILKGSVGYNNTTNYALRNATINVASGAQFGSWANAVDVTFNNNITLNGGAGPNGYGALTNHWWRGNTFTGTITLASATDSSIGGAYGSPSASNGAITISGPVIGSGSLTKITGNWLYLNGNNTYSGTTTINAGTVQIGAAGRLGGGSYSNTITNNGTLIYSGTNAQTLSGVISGTGNLTQNASSTLTLSNTNTFNGTTTINAGTLQIDGNIANSGLVINSGGIISPGTTAAADSFGTSSITINGGGYNWTLTTANGSAGTGWDQITSTGALTSSGLLTIYAYGTPGDWDDSANYDWDIISANSVTGFSSGNFALNLDYFGIAAGNRTGTWSFSNPSGGIIRLSYTALTDPTWAGGTGNWSTEFSPAVSNGDAIYFTGAGGGTATNNIASGTLSSLASIGFQPTAGAYILAANSGSAGNGSALTVTGGISNDSSSTQTINMDLDFTTTQTIAANSGNIAIGGVISGAGGLTKMGANTLTLSGANTYTGTTTVSVGTLAIINNMTIGAITGSGNLSLGSGYTLTTNSSTSTTYSGVISGSGALAKSGSGTLILTANNTYTGGTTVNAGTLQVGNGTNTTAAVAGTITLSGGNLTYHYNNSSNVNGNITLTAESTITRSNTHQLTFNSGTLNGGGQTLNVSAEGGAPPKFDPIVMRGFVGVSGWFRCLAERRP